MPSYRKKSGGESWASLGLPAGQDHGDIVQHGRPGSYATWDRLINYICFDLASNKTSAIISRVTGIFLASLEVKGTITTNRDKIIVNDSSLEDLGGTELVEKSVVRHSLSQSQP